MENHEANQAAFDKVVRHLLKQGEMSVAGPRRAFRGCAYRGHSGRMCAVGCLIPDDEYFYGFEGETVRVIYDCVPALQGLDKNLLLSLQLSHDHYPVSEWPERLVRVANKFGLTMPAGDAP